MSKNIFDVFKQMNQNDIDNKTKTLGLSNQCNGGHTVKAGAIIEMGVEQGVLMDILANKRIPILLAIDKAEYERILNA